MKPSEYLYNEDFMVLNDTYKLKIIDKLDKRFIDQKELNKALYDLNKDNYDNVYLYGDIITGRIERTLYNIEKKINKNIDIQKKAFKDSKIIKKRIKENKKNIRKCNLENGNFCTSVWFGGKIKWGVCPCCGLECKKAKI